MDVNLDKTTGNINSLEDRLWLAANLISLEEHSYSSYLRTSDCKYIRMMEVFRQDRITVLKDILGINAPNCEAELWCMFKHTLGAAMRAYESGNRETDINMEIADMYFGISKKMIEQSFEILEAIKLDNTPAEKQVDNIQTQTREFKMLDAPIKTKDIEKKHGLLYYLKCCLE